MRVVGVLLLAVVLLTCTFAVFCDDSYYTGDDGSTGKELTCEVSDQDCTELAMMLNGTILTFPSTSGVCTITHVPKNTLPGEPTEVSINEVFPSVSPLFLNALYSVECSNGRFMNLYEYLVPDTVWPDDITRTRAEVYSNTLHSNGLDVAGVHFHWYGSRPFLIAIHHQSLSFTPRDFVTATINALATVGYLP